MNTTHWETAQEIARNFSPTHSTVYAGDHIEALIDKRLVLKPEEWSAEKWEQHKANTSALQELREQISKVNNALHYESTLK